MHLFACFTPEDKPVKISLLRIWTILAGLFPIINHAAFNDLIQNVWQKFGMILFLPRDDIILIVIDHLKNFEARFFDSTILYSDGHPSQLSNPE